MTTPVAPETRAWCVARQHPYVTHNPLLDRTWCRCGERQEPGAVELDWQAKWAVFHGHEVDVSCRCYLVVSP